MAKCMRTWLNFLSNNK